MKTIEILYLIGIATWTIIGIINYILFFITDNKKKLLMAIGFLSMSIILSIIYFIIKLT